MRVLIPFLYLFLIVQHVLAEDCPNINIMEYWNRKNGNDLTCTRESNSSSENLTFSEGLYLPLAAERRKDQIICGRKTISALLEKTDEAAAARNAIIEYTDLMGSFIKTLKKEKVNLVAERGRLVPASNGKRLMEIDTQEAELQATIDIAYSGLFEGGTSEIRKLADTFGDKPELRDPDKAQLFQRAIRMSWGTLGGDKYHLEAEMKKNPKDYSDELKESLAKDLQIRSEILSESPTKQEQSFIETVSCHLDDNYGFRAEDRRNKRNAAIGILSLIVPVGEVYLLGRLGINAVGRAASILKIARYSKFAVAGAAGYKAFQNMVDSCLGDLRHGGVSSAKSCDLSNINTFVVQDIKRQSCLMTALISALELTPAALSEFKRVQLTLQEKLNAYERIVVSETEVSSVLNYSAKDYKVLNDFLARPDVIETMEKLKAQKDSHVLFMESVGATSNGGKTMVSPVAIFKNTDTQVNGLIKSGVIKENQAIFPARLYKNSKGEIVARRIGEDVPESFKPFYGTLNEKDYWRLVAEGNFPVGSIRGGFLSSEAGFGNYALGPVFIHDMTHLSGFIRNPEYMAAMRSLAVEMSKLTPTGLSNVRNQTFLISEMMAGYTSTNRNAVAMFLNQVKPAASPVYTVEQYVKLLSKKSEAELSNLIANVESKMPKIDGFGGTSGDSINKFRHNTGSLAPTIDKFRETANSQFSPLQRPLIDSSFLGRTINLQDPAQRQTAIKKLADQLTYADHMKEISPSQLVRDLLSKDKSSLTLRILCNSNSIAAAAKMQLCR